MLDISSVRLRNQDPSASEPEDSVFWACCKPTPLVPAEWTITPELVLAVCDDLTTSIPQEIKQVKSMDGIWVATRAQIMEHWTKIWESMPISLIDN